MKLPENTIISSDKLTQYLLVPKKRNYKSRWLAGAGYTLEYWRLLKRDLCSQILTRDAKLVEDTKYGQLYEIIGTISGKNGKTLAVHTIWMTETATGTTKFITMYPARRTNR